MVGIGIYRILYVTVLDYEVRYDILISWVKEPKGIYLED